MLYLLRSALSALAPALVVVAWSGDAVAQPTQGGFSTGPRVTLTISTGLGQRTETSADPS